MLGLSHEVRDVKHTRTSPNSQKRLVKYIVRSMYLRATLNVVNFVEDFVPHKYALIAPIMYGRQLRYRRSKVYTGTSPKGDKKPSKLSSLFNWRDHQPLLALGNGPYGGLSGHQTQPIKFND